MKNKHCHCEACDSTAAAIQKKRSHIIRKCLKPKLTMTLTLLPLLPILAQAETCTPTPDCKSLGYTQTSCPDNKGVRCPWNTSLLYCGENRQKICADMGYSNTCTGAHEIPSGKACANKYYASCSCASGYELKNGICEEKPKNGIINGLYYCNGVLKGIQVGSENLIIALNDLGNIALDSALLQCEQYNFCDNTNGNVPTKDQLTAIHNNINTIQYRLSSNGETQFNSGYYWSSTFYSNMGNVGYWAINPIDNKTIITHFSIQNYVRCIASL